jgi:hypothetical protein
MKLIKVLKSKWWDLFPAASFLAIAVLEGKGFWIGGVSLIVWLFTLAVRNWVK